MNRIVVGTQVLLAAAALLQSRALGQAPENPEVLASIDRVWQDRRRSVHAIEYRLEGKGLVPKGTFTGEPDLPPPEKGPIPPADYTYDIAVTEVVDFHMGFAKADEKQEIFYSSLLGFGPSHSILMYDGKRLINHMPKASNTGKGYTPSDRQPSLWEAVNMIAYGGYHEKPVFLLAGRFFDISPNVTQLNSTIDLKNCKKAAPGKQGRRDCIVLTYDSASKGGWTQQFWFDAGVNKALLRWIQSTPTGVLFDIRFTYADPDGRPWPESWDIAWYDPPNNRLMSQSKMRVVSLETNKPYLQEDFQVKRAPGMVVAAKGGFVRVNDDLSTTKISLDTPGQSTSHRHLWSSLLRMLGIGLPVVMLAAIVLRRARAAWRYGPERP